MTARWKHLRFPAIPALCSVSLIAMAALPRISGNPRLAWSVAGAGAFMLAWEIGLWLARRGKQAAFEIEWVPVKSHWVQACVQCSILLYWGWYWRRVYDELPLVLAQVFFLYSLEGMMSWARGRTWRLGFGPLPIILSTNLLLWFRDDWFFLQFAMVAAGVMGKQFMMWRLPDRQGHIFNPSAFGQTLIALALIATATTKQLTWGPQIAATFEVPYMLVVIFAGGLVVQYLFGVTLMTLAAAATLCLVNIVYTQATGVYFFVNISIAAPIFLGIHLLVTDPSTSPRTNVGRVLFGSAYALSYCVLFRVLDMAGIPIFWDKLLPVPILNLCVPAIDRLCRSGAIGRLNAAWEGALSPRALNLVHMGCWGALFGTMMLSGFAYGRHPGNTTEFWRTAVKEGKPYAERSLAMQLASQAMTQADGSAANQLGLMALAGKGVPQDRKAAAEWFAQSCSCGDISGCENVAIQFLFLHEMRSEEAVAEALNILEAMCGAHRSQKSCYLLATAYETGRGRPKDLQRAIDLLLHCDPRNGYVCKSLARIALTPGAPSLALPIVASVLHAYSHKGDAEASWYLAYLYLSGTGVTKDVERGRAYLQASCDQGSQVACQALREPEIPPFKRPVMVVPGWSSGDESAETSKPQ